MKTIKLIDLLNKIANGEINEDIKIECQYGFNYEYCTIRDFFDRYIVDKENLNQEITLEDTPKEDKKIEKIEIINNGNANAYAIYSADGTKCALTKHSKVMCDKINEIIDKINEMSDKE